LPQNEFPPIWTARVNNDSAAVPKKVEGGNPRIAESGNYSEIQCIRQQKGQRFDRNQMYLQTLSSAYYNFTDKHRKQAYEELKKKIDALTVSPKAGNRRPVRCTRVKHSLPSPLLTESRFSLLITV
jgi:hypothetical protein